MTDIVKLNIYLVAEVDPAEIPKMRAIRDRYVNVERPPASTLVVVSRLARPGWLIEIEAVAAIEVEHENGAREGRRLAVLACRAGLVRRPWS